MSEYLVGIDGGASRSCCIVTDLAGVLISSSEGASLNPLAIGWDVFSENFKTLYFKALGSISPDSVAALCAGIAGVGDETVRERASNLIIEITALNRIHVITDALAALWGAFGGNAGLLLIAGTGSICYGMDEDGLVERSGGFGRLLGDEGGGYWIAIEAIKSALKSADGRADASSLPPAVSAEFNLKEVRDIIPQIHGDKLPPGEIARFAEKVLILSASDPSAADIVKRAAVHLTELLVATARKLNIAYTSVALSGGLWNSPGQEMQKALSDELKQRQFKCEIRTPSEPPEWGAIRYLQKSIPQV